MALVPHQTLVTVIVKGTGLEGAPEKVREALVPYTDARIIAMTQKSNWMTSFSGETTLLIAIEYTPRG
ncbi:hypothetical protein [Arthrobacter pigmenti]